VVVYLRVGVDLFQPWRLNRLTLCETFWFSRSARQIKEKSSLGSFFVEEF
jgi:hypothetical protein